MTIQFASHNHALISDPTEPKVVFGRASTFKGSEGRIVCSPEVVNFYRAAFMLKGMQYVAALGVGMYTVNFVYYNYTLDWIYYAHAGFISGRRRL